MISKVYLRYLRIAPRKVRLVADLIRGQRVDKAQVTLNFTNKKAALPILKLLKQAVSNARTKLDVQEDNLYISKITVDEGPKLKRQLPRARGRADIMHKKTSHITLIIDEIEKKAKKVTKATKVRKGTKATEATGETKEAEAIKKDDKDFSKKLRQRDSFERSKAKQTKGLRRFFRRKAI
jgi:large subunit ribosomal protein L22